MSIEVTGLNYYPVKSCAGISAQELDVTETGFLYDREWMVVDGEGTFMSQRQNPEMVLIRPEIEVGWLKFEAPGMEDLAVPVYPPDNENLETKVHKASVGAISYGKDASDWLSEYLKTEARLVKTNPDQPREIIERYQREGASNCVGFADGFAFLLASEVSLEELNAHLPEPVPMNRFRPNIVIKGEDLEAYEEDYWPEVRIGNMWSFVVRASARCPIPDTDQSTGIRPEDRPVTAALRATRHGLDTTNLNQGRGNFFGQNLNHVFQEGITIKVGDEVEPLGVTTKRNITLI